MSCGEFNFHTYLKSKNFTEQFTVQELSGGYTNLTIRVNFKIPVQFCSQLISSAILKYAPPFVATAPSQPMSVYRQTVEARALQIFAGLDNSFPISISPLLDQFNLRVPALIYHDTSQNVLWISDLVDTRTLSVYLLSEPTPHELNIVATQLARFIFELHSATANPSAEVLLPISNPIDANNVSELLYNLTKTALLQAEVPDAEVLALRVQEGLQDKGEDTCLGMVDFWPESILIDENRTLGLIDWEYFGLSSAGSELGHFLAHLHVLVLNSQASEVTIASTRHFISRFLETYTKYLGRPTLDFKRQMLISHGRELINAVELYADKLDEASKTQILWAGVRSLRAAGDKKPQINMSILECPSETRRLWEDFVPIFSFDS